MSGRIDRRASSREVGRNNDVRVVLMYSSRLDGSLSEDDGLEPVIF